MRPAVLSFILIFALQSQASFLSRILYNSEFYKSCFGWSISDVPLSIYHDAVDEQDGYQGESDFYQDYEIITSSSISANIEAIQTRVMNVLRGFIGAKPHQETETCEDDESEDDDSYLPAEITDINSPGKEDLSPSDHSQKQLTRTKKKTPRPKRNIFTLWDSTNNVEDVLPVSTGTESSAISQGQLAPQLIKQFEELFNQGKYDQIFELCNEVGLKDERIMEQLSPAIKTFEQYNKFDRYLEGFMKMMLLPYHVYGDIKVVKEIIMAKAEIYKWKNYVHEGFLEVALPLALERDSHDRVIDLLNIRKEITVEADKQFALNGKSTSFEEFAFKFLVRLAPWEDGMTLKRFLTFRGNELRDKHSDILDTLCQELVDSSNRDFNAPRAKGLLMDLIGQPLLLSPMAFAKGFLWDANDIKRSNFIKRAWKEAIQEGLKKKYRNGGGELWRVMKEEHPKKFSGDYPSTDDALVAVLKHFPTKQELEEQWIREHAPGFLETLDQVFANILPTVLVSIVIEYARPTWIDF